MVSMNQYSLELPLMSDTGMPSQPLRMTWLVAPRLERFSPFDALPEGEGRRGRGQTEPGARGLKPPYLSKPMKSGWLVFI